MTFKPALWHPIAIALSGLNLVAAGYAAGSAEPWHAAIHASLAVAFGFWSQRLRQAPGVSERPARLEELEADMSDLQRELSEAQERLDFAERMLAQRPESPRVEPER